MVCWNLQKGFIEVSKVPQKTVGAAVCEVFRVVLEVIGLPLEADILVCFIGTPVDEATHQPFGDIEQVKRYDQELRLLPQVYALMVNQDRILTMQGIPNEDKGPEG